MTGLRTDGGTAFGVWSDATTWNPALANFVDVLRRSENDEPEDAQLILPPLPGGAAPGLVGVLDDGVDWRTLGFGGEWGMPVASVYAEGRSIVLHFRDRAFCRLSQREDPKTGTQRWYLRVEAKHRELYARDVDRWLATWLGYWSWLLFGTWTPVAKLRGVHGWTTTQWHVNADFVGLRFSQDDCGHFVGPRRRGCIGTIDELDDGFQPEVDDDDDDPLEWAQTLHFGRKTSDIMLVGYKKGDQLRQAKGIRPEASAYAVHWRAHDWQPHLDGDPFRVELRARKKGLVYRDATSDRTVYDFRDPALLCDDEARRAFWSYVTSTRRLVERKGTRIERDPTDPRWRIVQSVANVSEPAAIRQFPHVVAKMTRHERVTKSTWNLLRALQDVCAEEDGVLVGADPMDVVAAMHVKADELLLRVRNSYVDLDRFGEDVFPNPRSMRARERNCVAKVQFFLPELFGRDDTFAEQLRARGGSGGRSIIEACGPPALLDEEKTEETGT